MAALLLGCATPGPVGPSAVPEVEGLVRRRDASCEAGRGFVLAIGSQPVAGRRFSLHPGASPDAQALATVVTSEEGAFRVALAPGRYCVVDRTGPGSDAVCAAQLVYEPASEPVPIITLPPLPCPR